MSPNASTAVADGAPSAEPRGALVWLLAIIPLVLLGALLALIVGMGPTRLIQGNDAPPVERLVFTRVDLIPGEIRLSLLNDGPDDVHIAQVTVDDAFWAFQASEGTRLSHLDRTTLSIPYP